jgi:hypothetical protein
MNGTKSFVAGAAAGFVLMLLLTVVVIVPEVGKKYEKAIDQRDDLLHSLTSDHEQVNAKMRELIEASQKAESDWQQRLETCQDAVTTDHTRDAMYTLVYEPAPASAAPSSLALLDLMKPGLGAMLAKLQAAPPPQMRLRYVLHGIVAPVAAAPGSRFIPTQEVQLQ